MLIKESLQKGALDMLQVIIMIDRCQTKCNIWSRNHLRSMSREHLRCYELRWLTGVTYFQLDLSGTKHSLLKKGVQVGTYYKYSFFLNMKCFKHVRCIILIILIWTINQQLGNEHNLLWLCGHILTFHPFEVQNAQANNNSNISSNNSKTVEFFCLFKTDYQCGSQSASFGV